MKTFGALLCYNLIFILPPAIMLGLGTWFGVVFGLVVFMILVSWAWALAKTA